MLKRIKLMAHYECYPLWHMDGEVGDIDPMTLSLSSETRSDLHAWAAMYDDTLDWDDPAQSGFKFPEDADRFERKGLELWQTLQVELSGEYEVVYQSYKLQKIISDLRELEAVMT